MNKEIINIDGKTYVRQDSPTIDPDEIAKAKALLEEIKHKAFSRTFIFAVLLTLFGLNIVYSFILFVIGTLVSSQLSYTFYVKPKFSKEIWDAVPPYRSDKRTSGSYSHMPYNVYYRHDRYH